MTESQSFALSHTPAKLARDAGSKAVQPTLHHEAALAAVPFMHPDLYATDDSDRVAPLLMVGLAALLLPTFAYTWSVLVSMTANGTLEKAVRAIVP